MGLVAYGKSLAEAFANVKLLKAQGCANDLFTFLEAFDKLVLAWRRTESPPLDKKGWDDVQVRLNELRAALREG